MITPVRISNTPAGINCGPEYAKVCPWSKDNKWLLLTMSGGWFRLHNGGEFVRTLPSDVHTSSRPRWSRFNPDSFTFRGTNSLFTFDAPSGSIGLVRTFPEYAKIDDSGEADLSNDGNYRVLAGTRADGSVEVFAYNMAAGKKGTVRQVSAFDGLSVSADNQIIISQAAGISVGGEKPWKQITPRNAHACPCVYKGRPSLAWFNGAQHLVIVDLETAQQAVVPFVIDYAYVAHVSSCDKQILCMSLSAPKNDKPAQIVRISLDDLSAEVLCEPKIVYRDSDSQPNASLSRDGSRCVFRVDDGQQRSAWMLKLDKVDTLPDKVDSATRIETRIDYSQFVGKSEFVLVPRPDGAVDIVERKLR